MASLELDLGQLSAEQQAALQQYTSVTDQDVQAAIGLLQRSQWNVQIAIAKFFDGEGPDPVAEALAAQNVPPPRTTRQENLQHSLLHESTRSPDRPDAAPRIVPQPEDQAVYRPPFLFAILFTPFRLLYKLLAGSLGFFAFLFPFLPAILRPNPAPGARTRSNVGRRALKPRDAAARLKREIEEEYGPNSLPIFDGGYAQALDLAKKDLRFLMVFLISSEHDDNSSFLRDTLLTSTVTEFISNPRNNIILWAGDVRDSEAYQVSNALRCTKFPFTALITHTPASGSTSMSVVARLTGPMSANTYVSKMQNAVNAHAEQLTVVRAARSAQEAERNLRQEQEFAYERSLAQDREKARQRREAEALAAEAERNRREEAAAAAKLQEQKTQWRQWRVRSIAPEPSPDAKDVVRVRIAMPEAGKVLRRFAADTGIEELYAFVDCYDYLGEETRPADAREPKEYEHSFDFRLVSTLPRVVYDPEEGGTIGERVGKNGNLIVEPIKDDAEDDA